MLILLNKCIIKEIRKNTLQENAGKNEWKLNISKSIYIKYWINNKLT